MSTVIIVKKARRFIPVELDIDKGQVRAALSKHAARRTGCASAYATGIGAAAIRTLLANDLDAYDSIRALKEAFVADATTFRRVTELDR